MESTQLLPGFDCHMARHAQAICHCKDNLYAKSSAAYTAAVVLSALCSFGLLV
jgi:hypothetical protein